MKRDCKCFTHRWVVFRNTFKVNLGKRGAETEFFSKVSEETLGENSKTDIKSIYGKHKCREKIQFKLLVYFQIHLHYCSRIAVVIWSDKRTDSRREEKQTLNQSS